MVRMRWFPKMVKIMQSTLSRQILQQLEREEINPFRFYAVALNLLLILNLAFLSWKFNSVYGLVFAGAPSLLQFTFFFGCILVIFTFRFFMNRVLGFLTGERKVLAEYSINSALVNQTFGILVFPFVILLQFGPFNVAVLLWISLFILSLALLLKWYRGLRKGLIEEGIGFLQIFSYFCALEILPVFVLVKYIVENF